MSIRNKIFVLLTAVGRIDKRGYFFIQSECFGQAQRRFIFNITYDRSA